jgi:hypothetical protein
MAIIKTTWLDIIYGHNQYSSKNNTKNVSSVYRKHVQVLNVVGQSTCGFSY